MIQFSPSPTRNVLATLSAAALLSASISSAEEVKLSLISTNAMKQIGSYMPQRIALSGEKPAGIKKVPSGLSAPKFGEFTFGAKESPMTVFVIVDEPEGKEPRLFVDANGNGDLTDDAAVEWVARTNKTAKSESVTCFGGATLKVPYGSEMAEVHVPMYRFSKPDAARMAMTNTMFYYSDYARTGNLTLSGKSYAALLIDPSACGDFRGPSETNRPASSIMIDVNGDGKFDRRHESFPLDKPFNIGGTTYELSGLKASGASVELAKSAQSVAETVPPPSLTANTKSLPFTAENTAGKMVNFPEGYKGKLVMLDFWATWCGPCVGELPHLTNVYSEFHPKGLEVLGISLDQPKNGEKLANFTKEHNMPWDQVYDGKYWQAAVAQKYFIESIPHAFLVDGDTGMIVAEGNSLRGEQLEKTVKAALEKKASK